MRGGGRAHADHPRSRGVYAQVTRRTSQASGSSPLARGLLGPQLGDRIHPVDHPRSRGVYGPRTHGAHPTNGSSPLARGLHHRHLLDRLPPGIIPARAGFTASAHGDGRGHRDHPRSRGGYVALPANDRIRDGSSPLARGLLPTVDAFVTDFRIIPARAGFTNFVPPRLDFRGDHPRSRGVYRGR